MQPATRTDIEATGAAIEQVERALGRQLRELTTTFAILMAAFVVIGVALLA